MAETANLDEGESSTDSTEDLSHINFTDKETLEYVIEDLSPAGATFGSRTTQDYSMHAKKRSVTRPLGYYVPESRLELQLEKALFNTNTKILAEMCRKKKKQDLKGAVPPNTPMLRENISPEVRWLLTRSANLQRKNNAEFAKYKTRFKERVVSAGGNRTGGGLSLVRHRTMCNRMEEIHVPRASMRTTHCDVLGPYFCYDCTKMRTKYLGLREEGHLFPDIEVHSRALIAPQKVEHLMLSYPEEVYSTLRNSPEPRAFDLVSEMTTPRVFTQHDVFARLRAEHKEKGNCVFATEKKKTTHGQGNGKDETKGDNFLDRKVSVGPVMMTADDMKVSVKFRMN